MSLAEDHPGVEVAAVCADFTRAIDLLSRINRELAGSFEPRHFRHDAVWNEAESRIEMHLVSRHPQRVHVCGRSFAFAESETIHTENSYKYTVDGFRALAARAGFTPRKTWLEDDGLFSLHYLECR